MSESFILPSLHKNQKFGTCLQKWTPEYLLNKLANLQCVAHESDYRSLCFIKKNFIYKTLSFDALLKECFYPSDNSKQLYLRALGSNPRSDIADFWTSFPQIADDFTCPSSERYAPRDLYFSSVLRVSSANLQLWTHYDVMDNVLCQIVGRKRVVMFPPSDAPYMYSHGDKSAVENIDNVDVERFPLFGQAHRYEFTMEPGDALVIPALWFHNVTALDASVAVNVFWRGLDAELYDKRDVYANRDPLPAQRAFQSLGTIKTHLRSLPPVYADFYARRIIADLQKLCLSDSENS